MSNGRRIRRHRRVNPIDAYARRLTATGMPEREVARAVLYVKHFGFDALSGPGCAMKETRIMAEREHTLTKDCWSFRVTRSRSSDARSTFDDAGGRWRCGSR